MNEVAGRCAVSMVENMRRLGVPTESALAKLPVGEATLREAMSRVDWAPFAEFMDEIEASCGGADAFEHALAEVQPMIAARYFPILRCVLSPRELYRMMHVLLRMSYVNLKVSEMDDADGHLVVTIEIPEPHRPCLAFLHACVGGMRSLPEVLGQARSHVVAELTPRRGTFTISLPESRTLAARLRRASSTLVAKTAVAEVERSWTEAQRRLAELEATNLRLADTTRRLEAEAERRDRAEAALRAVALPGAEERAFVTRLERVAETWRLTPRQVEVTALVVRGSSNKAIAVQLDCALHTVEIHVTEILKRSRLESRSALVAAFWSDT